LIAQGRQHRGARLDHDCRALVVHLLSHQDTPDAAEENTLRALTDHLRWPEARARATILRALDRGLIIRQGRLLALRPKGIAEAQSQFDRQSDRAAQDTPAR
jgi:manganese/zinc/iron transport system permease protein